MDTYIAKIIDTLLKEYELHRNELLLQIQLYNRQTQYIQLYGALLLGFLAFLSGSYPEWIKHLIGDEQIKKILTQTKSLSLVDPMIVIIVLGLAAAIAFYLVSAVMASAYLFLIIRRRMAHIEQEINKHLGTPNLLAYESKVTPHFLEKSRYGKGITFTPHFLSGVWRIMLFACIILILCFIARSILGPSNALPFSIFLASVTIIQVALYIWLNTKGKKNIDKFYQQESPPQKYVIQFITFGVFSIFFLITIFSPVLLKEIYSLIVNLLFSFPSFFCKVYAGMADLFRNIYFIFLNYESLQINYWTTLLYIFLYEVACAIFWPTPSEAPLLLYNKLPLFTIILVSALGKASGAYITFLGLDTINKLFKRRLRPLFWSKESIERFISNRGFLAYLFMQGVPFMPMRSSTLVYSFISRSGTRVALGAGIGTIFRNLIMFLLFWLGYVSMKALLGK
jgi:hypothetical protein